MPSPPSSRNSGPLIEGVELIKPVSAEASEAYARARENILEEVNRKMSARPDVNSLIGNNPIRIMLENHANHSRFMMNVFCLNDYGLLAGILPWVYRTYMNHGFDHTYFPEALRAWTEAVARELPPEEANEINRVYDWIIDRHDIIREVAPTCADMLAELDRNGEDLRDRFVELLLRGNYKECIHMARERVTVIGELAPFYLRVVQPALYRIGTLWECHQISVAQEHMSSAIVGRIMASLYELVLDTDKNGARAMVAACFNEHHEVGARMVSDLLESAGWQTTYLGANVPADDMIEHMRLVKPKVVAISLAMPYNLLEARGLVERIRESDTLRPTKVMVGGLAFNCNPEMWKNMGADGYAPDAAKAVDLAGRLLEEA